MRQGKGGNHRHADFIHISTFTGIKDITHSDNGIGIDTVNEIGDYLYSETGEMGKISPPILKEMFYSGYYGNKKIKKNSNGGWYDLNK